MNRLHHSADVQPAYYGARVRVIKAKEETMFSPWLLNVLLIVGIAFSVNRTVQRDNAIRALAEDFGITGYAAERMIEKIPAGILGEIVDKGTFREANLEDLDLRDMDFSGLDMTGVRFRNTLLDRSDFSGSNLSNADLREASLYWTIFTQATLDRARMQEANMENADFTGASLRSTSLYEAKATWANFTSANLYDAWMIDTTLFEANLSSTELSEVLLYGADLTTAIFDENTRFRGAYYNSSTVLPPWLDPPSSYGLVENDYNEDWFFWTSIAEQLQEYRNGNLGEDTLVSWLLFVPGYVTDNYIDNYDLPEEILERVK